MITPTRKPGFTLLEMMLVLAVLAVVAVVTVPAVDRMYRTHRLRQTANDLRAKLAATRLHSIDEGIAYQFRFEPNGRHFVVIPLRSASMRFGDEQMTSPGTWSFPAELPTGLVFASSDVSRERLEPALLKEVAGAQGLTNLFWSAPVIFTPNGRSTSAEFIVRETEGRGVKMTIRSLTGVATTSGVQTWPGS